MSDLIHLTIDGKAVTAAPGTLLINAAKQVGIEIPSFCYYDGLTLQAACRMCLVEVEKTPKLQVGCTLPVAEGMVVHTDSPQVHEARKGTLEFLLTNHPLDCPVCDKGGECELQDMTFRYGVGESRFLEQKQHVDEQQWSPVVFYDEPRCILCYRCVRICDEGMGVNALGVGNRGAVSDIAPNHFDHLECDECGMCIDICPVGALTSGTYRYKTRPWEMKHVGTICTHCADGCKTTLGVRNNEIIRGNNRDHSGINGEFLCIKGRYAFDFVHSPERLQSPMLRKSGKLEPVSWSEALAAVARKFKEVKARGGKFGVIGSNHTTNEENYYLQKFAREALGTNNIDHHRTGDVATLLDALSGKTDALATTADLYERKAILVVASDLAQQHPFLAFQIRANYRHHDAHVYTVTPGPVREQKHAVRSVIAVPGRELADVESLRDQLEGEPELVILFGDAIKGDAVRKLVAFGDSLGIPVQIRLPGGLFEFARRIRHGAVAQISARVISRSSDARPGLRRNSRGGRSGCAVGGGRESAEDAALAVQRRVRRGAGDVPHRNRAARRRRVPRRLRLRKERNRHQRLRRSAASEGRRASDGNQARPRNHRPARQRNGREPRHLVARQGVRRDSRQRAWL